MRKLRAARQIVLMILFAGARLAGGQPAPSVGAKAPEEISFCTELGDPPSAYLAKDGVTPEGFEVDIMNSIARSMAVRATIRNYKLSTVFAALDAGKCDVIVSQVAKNPERLEKYNFTPYRRQASGLMVPKGNPLNLRTYQDLANRRVAVVLGSINERRLKDVNEKLIAEGKQPATIVSFGTNAFAFQELGLGRVDALASGSVTLAYFMSLGNNKFEIGGMPVPPTTLGILTPKRELERARQIQAAIDGMVTSGEMQQIFAKWGVSQGTTPCGGGIRCD